MTKEFIEIDEEIEELLLEHGREMFLRQSTGQRCKCWDDRIKEASRECTSCSGFGFVYTDRKILAWREVTTDPGRAAYRRRPTEIGYTSVDEVMIYMGVITNPGIYPSEHDWIVECKTKTDGSLWQPYLIETIWDINLVTDFRENNSRLAYYAMAARRMRLGK